MLKDGAVVEAGAAAQVLGQPQHPYTQRLLSAVPVPDPDQQRERRELRDSIIEQEHIVS